MSREKQTKLEYTRQLRRVQTKFKRINSLDLIPEQSNEENSDVESNFSNWHTPNITRNNSRAQLISRSSSTLALTERINNFITFWPNLFIKLCLLLLRYMLYVPLSVAAPSFWLSALLWIFWKIIRLPINVMKWLLNIDALTNKDGQIQKKTVLISCGSTIQTLHLARNFHSSGARVIVFEFDGLFNLARFSSAVDKFYIVPKPSPHNVEKYINAICHIVEKEKPTVYIPVCATSPAYYDSLAKPHLELLGCASFIPGLQETIALDDCLRFYEKCSSKNISTPDYSILSSTNDLWHLYETGFISGFRNIIMAVGIQGLLERYKYVLPTIKRDFKFNHEINEQQQWIVVKDQPGDHYVTCTTVKESRIVANFTCKVEHDTNNLIPIISDKPSYNLDQNSDAVSIENWLKAFFAKVHFHRAINGHISFRLVKCKRTGSFLPLGVRVGVALPYICYNRSHAQILCRTIKCAHQKQFSLLNSNDENLLSAFSGSLSWSKLEKTTAAAPLDKREALFTYWDPLPYSAYYHFQLPLESVKMFLKRHRQNVKAANSKRVSKHSIKPLS